MEVTVHRSRFQETFKKPYSNSQNSLTLELAILRLVHLCGFRFAYSSSVNAREEVSVLDGRGDKFQS